MRHGPENRITRNAQIFWNGRQGFAANVGNSQTRLSQLPKRLDTPTDGGRFSLSHPMGYLFSVSRFHVPQRRSKIAQRFIAGLWREHKNESRQGRKNPPVQSRHFCRPAGALAILHSQPTVETVGYFRSSLSGLWDTCSSVVQADVPRCVQRPHG